MRITSAGNVAIGSTSANFPLSFGANIGKSIALYESSGTNMYGIGMGGLGTTPSPYRTQLFANGSEAVSITATGNVGIGIVNPSTTLNLYSSTKPTLTFGDSTLGNNYGGQITGYGVSGNGGYLSLGTNDNNTYNEGIQLTQQATNIIFKTSTGTNGTTAERMRINSTGYVGIGQSSPGAYLDILTATLGNTVGNIQYIFNSATNDGNTDQIQLYAYRNTSTGSWPYGDFFLRRSVDGTQNQGYFKFGATVSGSYLAFSSNSTEHMRIDPSGNIFVGGTTQNTATGIVYAKTTAKAWAKWGGGNQTTAGSIFASYNCSSITVNSTGRYTFNFTNAMASANYAISALTSYSNGNTGVGISANQDSDNPPSSTRFDVAVWTSGYSNSNYVYASVFA